MKSQGVGSDWLDYAPLGMPISRRIFVDILRANPLRLIVDNTSDKYRANLEVLRAV
jgi:hypothetical protein